ncbi:MAG: hypothetical protein HYY96_02705 [Candidatus Tectomicrobia bacterium]|nr:hypothetical protein [Candidatus Tectomicrobia bacterium]
MPYRGRSRTGKRTGPSRHLGTRHSTRGILRKNLLSGGARFFTYPILSICVLTAAASVLGLIHPEVFDFMRGQAIFRALTGETKTVEGRAYGNINVEKFVAKAVDLHRQEVPPNKIVGYLEQQFAMSKQMKNELEAIGVPVDRALDYWGNKGLTADQTLSRLQQEGVNIQLGYDILKRRGVPVQSLIERAQVDRGVEVNNMKQSATQTERGKSFASANALGN